MKKFFKSRTGTCKFCKGRRTLVKGVNVKVCLDCAPSWRERNARKRKLKERLSEAYERLEAVHGNCCMICGLEPSTRRMNVDHNHRTGMIRGLLCYRCNYGLHWFCDDPMRLKAAADYILQFDD